MQSSPIKRQTHLPVTTLNAGIIWVRKYEAKLTMTKVLFFQDAKLLLKVTLKFGGGITCSWNVLSARIYNDSAWCITTVVLVRLYKNKKKGLTEITVVSVEAGKWNEGVYFDCVEAQSILQCASCYRLHVTQCTVRFSWIDPCVLCQCIAADVLCVPREARFRVLVSGLNIFTPLRPKLAEMKAPHLLLPWLAKGYCLVTALLRTFVTYRLTFMAQHALLDVLGQDQVARLRSGPLEDYNSPCVLCWAWRGEQHKCALFYHRVDKIELSCALCFWKLPRVNTCAAPIVRRCKMHTLHSETQNNLKDIGKRAVANNSTRLLHYSWVCIFWLAMN